MVDVLMRLIILSGSFGSSETQAKWAAARQNQQNDLWAQQRLRSAWASAQSDQSLCCPHEETLGPQLPTQRTAGYTDHFVGFVLRRLK